LEQIIRFAANRQVDLFYSTLFISQAKGKTTDNEKLKFSSLFAQNVLFKYQLPFDLRLRSFHASTSSEILELQVQAQHINAPLHML